LNGPEIPWPEKAVSAIAEVPGAEIEVHAVHVPPGSSNGWIKIDTFNGIFRRLARVSPVARILCGDLNSPQCETADGQVVTWGQKLLDGCSVTRGKYKGRTGKEWDEGERSVLVGLADFDLYDVFRGLHGFGREDFSWHLRRKGETIRRRFDHLFASRRFGVRSCQYLHRCRESGLSDHSPIAARLEVPV
jgi:exonuclease III